MNIEKILKNIEKNILDAMNKRFDKLEAKLNKKPGTKKDSTK